MLYCQAYSFIYENADKDFIEKRLKEGMIIQVYKKDIKNVFQDGIYKAELDPKEVKENQIKIIEVSEPIFTYFRNKDNQDCLAIKLSYKYQWDFYKELRVPMISNGLIFRDVISPIINIFGSDCCRGNNIFLPNFLGYCYNHSYLISNGELEEVLHEPKDEYSWFKLNSRNIPINTDWMYEIFPKKEITLPSKEYVWKLKEEVDEFQENKDTILFRGVQILHLEVNFMQEIEKLTKKEFINVDTINKGTKMSFTASNSKVTGIGLNLCGLSILPESIGNLSSLKVLYLGANKLTILPDSIGTLRALKELDLDNNNLTALPKSIGNLKSLTHLSLRKNHITTLPDSIRKLTSLQRLELYKNQLTSIPESIGNLKFLTHLSLGANQITTLPEFISNLSSLIELSISYNQISTLPESIGNLYSLETLFLKNNKLTNLPESIGKLKSLQWLDLDNNQFSTFPTCISNILSLTNLWFQNNQLTTLSESIGQLKSLKTLWLGGNKFTTFQEVIKMLEKKGVKIYL